MHIQVLLNLIFKKKNSVKSYDFLHFFAGPLISPASEESLRCGSSVCCHFDLEPPGAFVFCGGKASGENPWKNPLWFIVVHHIGGVQSQGGTPIIHFWGIFQ